MKGIIFTEFLEMVERDYGFEILNDIIDNAQLESKGIYSGVGTYNHKEFENLVEALSKLTKESKSEILKKYGHYVFQTFYKNYSSFFTNINHPFELLEHVDSHINKEVKKLYPDAELPKFETTRIGSKSMQMLYRSKRRMEYLALGLMEASFEHYTTFCSIEMKEENAESVLFTIKEK